MTAVVGMTEGGEKKTQRDPRMLPRTVIYDAELTLGLPPATSAASGMNAIAHCVEALYAHDANPVSQMLAEEGIRALAAALPRVVAAPADLDARGEALYGAWLAGASFRDDEPRAAPQALPRARRHVQSAARRDAFNRAAARDPLQPRGRAGCDAANCPRARRCGSSPGVYELEMRLGLRMKLVEIGMPADGLARAAKMATESPIQIQGHQHTMRCSSCSKTRPRAAPCVVPCSD
jgi:alcohol dehydrogenase class IV